MKKEHNGDSEVEDCEFDGNPILELTDDIQVQLKDVAVNDHAEQPTQEDVLCEQRNAIEPSKLTASRNQVSISVLPDRSNTVENCQDEQILSFSQQIPISQVNQNRKEGNFHGSRLSVFSQELDERVEHRRPLSTILVKKTNTESILSFNNSPRGSRHLQFTNEASDSK